MNEPIYFRQAYQLSVHVSPLDALPLRLTDTTSGTDAVIVPARVDASHSSWGLVMCTSLRQKANPKLLASLRTLSSGQLPQGTPRSATSRWLMPIDDNGRFDSHFTPMWQIPESVASFFQQAEQRLRDGATRIGHLISWRMGGALSHAGITSSVAEWSVDENSWRFLSPGMSGRISSSQGMTLSTANADAVSQMLASGINEPVYYELFWEAWELLDDAPRSALVIGVAALETAIKNAISVVSPQSAWLVDNVASPPVEKILRDYLPTFPVEGWPASLSQAIPEPLLQTVKKAVGIRNRIVHRGDASPSSDTVREILDDIRDILGLMDAYSGHQWALSHVSYTTQRHLMAAVHNRQ